MKIRLTIDVDLGENFINPNDEDERSWLFVYLLNKELYLHSNEIGDELGEIINVKEAGEIL